MRTTITIIITAIIFGTCGYFLGFNVGINKAEREFEFRQKFKTVEELKLELEAKENEKIASLVDGTAQIKKVDEGGWLNTDYHYYFNAEITNSACVAIAKDIKLKVNYFSSTGTKISSEDVVIYEFVEPNQKILFKQEVFPPKGYSDLKFSIVSVDHK